MVPKNRVPFKFDIQWNIESINEDQSQIQAIINADLNMMMRMMAEKPLNDFINTQIHKLSDKLSWLDVYLSISGPFTSLSVL